MTINLLPVPNAGRQRIQFAHVSPPLVAQALADARERLVAHFPTVRWATWRATLRQLQLDVLVDGKVVTFDWQDLLGRVQGLVASLDWRALDLPAEGPGAEEELRAFRQQAVQALAELQAAPHVVGPLLCALVTQLAQGPAVAAAGPDGTQAAGPDPANQPSSLALEPPFPALTLTSGPLDLLAGKGGLDLVSPVPLRQPNSSGRARHRTAARRRTFRDIVERHPRADGKVGFTVRELCRGMRISAASLTEARINPGHLTVDRVVAFAEMMGESPLHVFYDLMVEAGAKPRRKRKKRVTSLTRPKKSALA